MNTRIVILKMFLIIIFLQGLLIDNVYSQKKDNIQQYISESSFYVVSNLKDDATTFKYRVEAGKVFTAKKIDDTYWFVNYNSISGYAKDIQFKSPDSSSGIMSGEEQNKRAEPAVQQPPVVKEKNTSSSGKTPKSIYIPRVTDNELPSVTAAPQNHNSTSVKHEIYDNNSSRKEFSDVPGAANSLPEVRAVPSAIAPARRTGSAPESGDVPTPQRFNRGENGSRYNSSTINIGRFDRNENARKSQDISSPINKTRLEKTTSNVKRFEILDGIPLGISLTELEQIVGMAHLERISANDERAYLLKNIDGVTGYYMKEYITPKGCELYDLNFIFYNDNLYQITSPTISYIGEVFTAKYGKPSIDNKEREGNMEKLVCTWNTGDKAMACFETIFVEKGRDGKENIDFYILNIIDLEVSGKVTKKEKTTNVK